MAIERMENQGRKGTKVPWFNQEKETQGFNYLNWFYFSTLSLCLRQLLGFISILSWTRLFILGLRCSWIMNIWNFSYSNYIKVYSLMLCWVLQYVLMLVIAWSTITWVGFDLRLRSENRISHCIAMAWDYHRIEISMKLVQLWQSSWMWIISIG